jgi:tetratricopeptide (TPR) repeat protein
MKRVRPILVVLAAAVFFAVTGFQCGSAEVTTAKLAMQQKQYDKAEQSLVKQVEKNPTDEEAWFLLGQVRLELKKYMEMNDAYTKALEIAPTHKTNIEQNRLAIWAQLYNEGVQLYNKGRDSAVYFDQSISDFNTAIALNPDSASTYYVSGLAYYAKGDVDIAAKRFQLATEKKAGYADAYRLLGKLTMEQAQKLKEAKNDSDASNTYMKAAEYFEKLVQAEPADADNITYLIEAYELSGQQDKALKLTKDAVTENPGNYVYRFAYGVFLLRNEAFPEAVEQFTKALEIEPKSADATYNLGVAYLNWGVALKEAAEKKVENMKDAKVDQSYKEKFKAALPYLKESTVNRPDDAALWLQLGRVYANLNMVKESKEAFDKADKISGSH